MINHQVRLASRPVGLPTDANWEFTEEAVAPAGEGEFVVKISHISLDPAMRGWMNAGRSYIAPVEVGDVMRAGTVGQVVQSAHPGFAAGDEVYGAFGVQEYATSDGTGVQKIDSSRVPLTTYLAALGLPGMTAYFGLLDTGELADGETVVVSGAAGAVGSLVGQIAKIKGCRVVGIAGGPAKCAWLTDELGFDAAIDYHAQNVAKELRTLCPQGIDVYFDNVGGEILDAALTRLARGARDRDLRRGVAVQRDHGGAGTGELPVAAGVSGLDERHGRVRLRRSLRRGGGAAGRLAGRRAADLA